MQKVLFMVDKRIRQVYNTICTAFRYVSEIRVKDGDAVKYASVNNCELSG